MLNTSRNTSATQKKFQHKGLLLRLTLLTLLLCGGVCYAQNEQSHHPLEAKKILFLGDSITHAGHYVAWLEAQLRHQGVQPRPQLLNLGLPSETCSGLSEPDHPFPRPNVHERLDRALQKVQPDLVVACYGMNDGIYYPLSEARFRAYQQGIRKLVKKVKAAGARCVLMTPPPFDPEPLRGAGKLLPAGADKYAYFAVYEGYDDVLRRYGQWLMEEMRDEVDIVIDLHGPVTAALKEARKSDPAFRFAGDGVHLNAAGHQIIGEAILRAWPREPADDLPAPLLKLAEAKTKVLHDAWLSHVGHKRPGGRPGLPLDEAQAKARQLDEQMERYTQNAERK